MDRSTLLGKVPDLLGRSQAERHQLVGSFLEEVLDAFALSGREPADYVAEDLGCAIGALFVGMYVLAMSDVLHAIADPEDRIDMSAIERTPPTLKVLRERLTRARNQSVVLQ